MIWALSWLQIRLARILRDSIGFESFGDRRWHPIGQNDGRQNKPPICLLARLWAHTYKVIVRGFFSSIYAWYSLVHFPLSIKFYNLPRFLISWSKFRFSTPFNPHRTSSFFGHFKQAYHTSWSKLLSQVVLEVRVCSEIVWSPANQSGTELAREVLDTLVVVGKHEITILSRSVQLIISWFSFP